MSRKSGDGWLKGLFDQQETEGRLAAERELERSRNAPGEKTKDRVSAS